jgi:4,5-dihydroxyphthalate decarboxylase
MLLNHEIDGTLHYISSLNAVDRSGVDLLARPEVRRLFPDPLAEGRRYYAKTGLFPINHCVVVRSVSPAASPRPNRTCGSV